MFEPSEFPAQVTVKVPGPVKVWTLKFVQTVVIVPPVAVINCASAPTSAKVDWWIDLQPTVEST